MDDECLKDERSPIHMCESRMKFWQTRILYDWLICDNDTRYKFSRYLISRVEERYCREISDEIYLAHNLGGRNPKYRTSEIYDFNPFG